MRSVIVTLSLLVGLGLGSAEATPVACPSDTTLAALIALNTTGGCQSQDKIFTDFGYSGADPASSIEATLIFESPSATQQVHGFSFSNTNAAGEWLSSFTLSFVISVAPGHPNVTIVASKDQIDSGLTGSANGTAVIDTQSVGTLGLNGLSTSNETNQISYGGVTSVATSTSATIPAGDLLIRYDQTFFESITAPVPEPASYILLGGGLLLLGILRRKK